MTRRNKDISPLVAARLKPVSKPPAQASQDSRPCELKLVNHHERPVEEPQDRWTAAREELRGTAAALRMADESLGEIQSRLLELGRLIGVAKELRRRPPQTTAALQTEIDAALDAIEELAEGAAFNGIKLLRGDWSPQMGAGFAEDAESQDCRRACTEAMDTRRLVGRSSGFLSLLRTGNAKAADRTDLFELHAIIEDALTQLADQREQIVAFLRRQVEPLLHEIEVARENAAAAQTLFDDPEFISGVGNLSGAHAVAWKFENPPKKSAGVPCRIPPHLRIVNDDAD